MCWCSCLTLALLRVAIGGHFLYEGLTKIDSLRARIESVPTGQATKAGWRFQPHREVPKPFSAEGYLANASGPFRGWFRGQLDDPDGRKRLEPASINEEWRDTVRQLDARHRLTDEQRRAAEAKIRELELAKESQFDDPEFAKRLQAYWETLAQTEDDERSILSAERERARDKRKDLAKTRGELLATVDAWNASLRDSILKSLTPEQANKATSQRGWLASKLDLPFELSWPQKRLDQINLMTMCGLTVAGACLVVGLFSRLSALWAAVFLAMIYLSNPAPPLGAGNPADPGHYLFVNKELIECLAALVLATVPTGRWLGLDALIRGLITRRLSRRFFGSSDNS